MRQKQLAKRHVGISASGESLRPLSSKEIQQVTGAAYNPDTVDSISGPLPAGPDLPPDLPINDPLRRQYV